MWSWELWTSQLHSSMIGPLIVLLGGAGGLRQLKSSIIMDFSSRFGCKADNFCRFFIFFKKARCISTVHIWAGAETSAWKSSLLWATDLWHDLKLDKWMRFWSSFRFRWTFKSLLSVVFPAQFFHLLAGILLSTVDMCSLKGCCRL